MTGTGPVLRYDITTNDWVLFAAARARHARAIPPRADDAKSTCPFCPGNEHLTPGEIIRVDDASEAGWSVRVVPNKFPAPLEPGASSEQTEICPLADQSIEQIERDLGSGMPINPMLPEEATRRLRGEPANASVRKGPP